MGKKSKYTNRKNHFYFHHKRCFAILFPQQIVAFTTQTTDCIYYTKLQVLRVSALPPFALGQHRKSKGETARPLLSLLCLCLTPVRELRWLFYSFICMLGANPAMDLKTNHSYWFHCEFAMWNNSHRSKGCLIARCTQKQDQKNNPQPNNKGTQNSPLL